MRQDLFPAIDVWLALHGTNTVAASELLCVLCVLIIFGKLATGQGALRRYLLWLFGCKLVGALLMAGLYHPYYNYWLPILARGLELLSLVALTLHVIAEYWFVRPPPRPPRKRSYRQPWRTRPFPS